MTTPNTPKLRRTPPPPKMGRGGGTNRPQWINSGLTRVKRNLPDPPTMSLPKKDLNHKDAVPDTLVAANTPNTNGIGGENDDDEIEDDKNDEENESNRDGGPRKSSLADGSQPSPKNTDSETEDTELATELEKIQILELHSENPIVMYKGHTFSCNWTENIGTELLFTARDADNPQPTLRSLHHGVDLLAASSARLTSTDATLLPKPKTHVLTKDAYSPQGKPSPQAMFNVPVGHGAGQARKDQAHFLQRMQEAKFRKGETDEVTIFATARASNKLWREQLQQKRREERGHLQQMVKRGGRWAEDAIKKLDNLNRSEGHIEAIEPKTITGKRPGRKLKDDEDSPRKRTKRANGALRNGKGRTPRGAAGHSTIEEESVANKASPPTEDTLSTPTPLRWDELEPETTTHVTDEDTPMSG
jgi:hypothetical protein